MNICPFWSDVMFQPRSFVCITRISFGLMINAGVLLASSRRLIFGGPMIALGLTGKFVHCQVRAIHLTVNNFPVNPRAITGPPNMSLLLEAKSTPALIIKPKLILVTHTDDLGWNITSDQNGQMLIQNINRIVS